MACEARQSAGVSSAEGRYDPVYQMLLANRCCTHLGDIMSARAMTEASGETRWERPPALRMLHSVAGDWLALVRRFRDAATAQAAAEALPRRRRDRHPDAPPRRPLFASRDLPAPELVRQAEAVCPAADPVASPRAPAPMSDAQIAQLMAAATARPIPVPPPCPAPVSQGWTRSLPRVATGDLTALADRFEQGTARQTPAAEDVEAALAKALATLRKLAEGHPVRPR